jgi:LPPG:FO 2-phospho-L-lactate transferase
MHFQEYLVKRRAQPKVYGIRFENIESAKPALGVAEAILRSDAIIICPSNPLISIGPILAVPGMRDLLECAEAPVAAISPVVGGASLKGPTDRMLADLGMQVSATQVAQLYSGVADVFILDIQDEAAKPEIENLGLKVCVTDTVMSGLEEKIRLAKFTLEALSS